jgi:hypothetical protein
MYKRWDYNNDVSQLNSSLLVGVSIAAVAVVVAVILYVVVPRYGPHYTSRLTCPNCKETFDYNWVPGGSFSAVRLGKSRYLSCPRCGKWSIFDIMATRVTSKSKGA